MHPNQNRPIDIRGRDGENEAAEVAADHGIPIEQLRETNPPGTANPDYRIKLKNGTYALAEGYSVEPTTDLDGMHRTLVKKVARQAPHILMRVDDAGQSIDDFKNYIISKPVPGMKQLIVIKGKKLYILH